jgi:hypothetical protein
MMSVSRNACWSKPSSLPPRRRGPFGAGLLPPEPPPAPPFGDDGEPSPEFMATFRRAWHGLHGEWLCGEEIRGILAGLRNLGLSAEGVPLG